MEDIIFVIKYIIAFILMSIGCYIVYDKFKGSFLGFISVFLISVSIMIFTPRVNHREVLMDYIKGDIRMIIDKKIYNSDTISTDTLFYDMRSMKYLK